MEVSNNTLNAVDIESIARMCHEANRAWCAINGDNSQLPWDSAADWQKDSAIAGVAFRLENPKAGDDAQHNAWMESKLNDGWVYGETKDESRKTHPCLVPFNFLPEFQQKKDAIFCAIVDTLKPKSTKNLTFGQAVEAAKKGLKVARAGWNGAGMFAYVVPTSERVTYTSVEKEYFGEHSDLILRTFWLLKTAQEDVATWTPSGSDSLANDWLIVE